MSNTRAKKRRGNLKPVGNNGPGTPEDQATGEPPAGPGPPPEEPVKVQFCEAVSPDGEPLLALVFSKPCQTFAMSRPLALDLYKALQMYLKKTQPLIVGPSGRPVR